MRRTFRHYHRTIAIIICIPLFLTVLSGMIYTILDYWLDQESRLADLILNIHTGKIFRLQAIYPLLNGFGVLGLLITGLSMTRLLRKRSLQSESRHES